MEPDVRDDLVEFIDRICSQTGMKLYQVTDKLGLRRALYYSWKSRFGQPNKHNGQVPRENWLEDWEHKLIAEYYRSHPKEGYRRCCYAMMDSGKVCVSPAAFYRSLKKSGAIRPRGGRPRTKAKGSGFEQPTRPHEHWHSDISMITIGDVVYFLIAVLDGYSRYIVSWDICTSMKTGDVQLVVQEAVEKVQTSALADLLEKEGPRMISDNGKQYKSKEFRELLGQHGLTQVTTSPYYPQSNGKMERCWLTLKDGSIRMLGEITLEQAKEVFGEYVLNYNEERLHSAIGYITPKDMLEGRQQEIFAERDRKLEARRKQRVASSRRKKAQTSTSSEENEVPDLGEAQVLQQ